METLTRRLERRFTQAAQAVYGEESVGFAPTIRPSRHADFQMNGALPFAKASGRNPREIATALLEHLDDPLLERVEVAGPGFVNVHLAAEALEQLATEQRADPHLGIPQTHQPETVVVDYAGPNIAKSMHVGHLRTCIIGDCFVRTFAALGHTVIRQDHQGDWGTQFGMLIEYLLDSDDPEAVANAASADLDALYRAARQRFDADEAFAAQARSRVTLLQGGDAQTLQYWKVLVDVSQARFLAEYRRLGILMTADDVRGENFYNDMLPDLVADLKAKGLAKLDDGAICTYPKGFVGRDGEPFAFIIQKSDGGYNYATTDLAAVRYSVDTLKATSLLYVTDVRQSQHFGMVFQVAREANWLTDKTASVHVGYGAVTGPNGQPYKTREGNTVSLSGLLDTAISEARELLSGRTGDLDAPAQEAIAHAVGVGAVKWADLKNECKNNYVFDPERMLAFQGNTGPYVQYASTRAKSVLRQAQAAGLFDGDESTLELSITEEVERQLALTLLGFGEAVADVSAKYAPHLLCTYLFELAETFTSFYEKCPVLKADDVSVRNARLAWCSHTARVLDRGLDLLGIAAVDRM